MGAPSTACARRRTPRSARLLPLAAGVIVTLATTGCGRADNVDDSARVTVAGTALAGPTCPVEQVPPDPSCADRPVEGAVIIIRNEAGDEVAQAATGPDGAFQTRLAPGTYRLEPQPVNGLPGTAPSLDLTVGPEGLRGITLSYDTGIR